MPGTDYVSAINMPQLSQAVPGMLALYKNIAHFQFAKFLNESDVYKQLICITQRVHFQIRVGVFNCQDKDFVSLILW